MTDPDPLREYMRIVRAINLCKLQLASINAKLRRAGRPARRDILEQRRKHVAAEMEVLREEGEYWLFLLRQQRAH